MGTVVVISWSGFLHAVLDHFEYQRRKLPAKGATAVRKTEMCLLLVHLDYVNLVYASYASDCGL